MKEASEQEINKSLKEKLVEIIRDYIKKKITGNLGFVVEEDDKLICYVKKEKCEIEISHSGYKIYHVRCKDNSQEYIDLIEKYNLDKKIVYVLDGLDFNRNEILEIDGDKDCRIEIKNCKFEYKFKIITQGDCRLKNIVIGPIAGPSFYIGAENIIMDNITIRPLDLFDVFAFDGFTFRLNASNLIRLNNFNVEENILGKTNLEVDTYFINMSNSNLRVEDITLNSKIIQSNNSLIDASGVTTLNVKEFNELAIKTLVISYNDKILIGGRELVCLKPIDEDLSNNRQALLLQLKEISEKLNLYNKGIVKCVEEKLNSNKVGKTYAKVLIK